MDTYCYLVICSALSVNGLMGVIMAHNDYSNIKALAQGCISGRICEWPQLKIEAKAVIEEVEECRRRYGYLDEPPLGTHQMGVRRDRDTTVQLVPVPDMPERSYIHVVHDSGEGTLPPIIQKDPWIPKLFDTIIDALSFGPGDGTGNSDNDSSPGGDTSE